MDAPFSSVLQPDLLRAPSPNCYECVFLPLSHFAETYGQHILFMADASRHFLFLFFSSFSIFFLCPYFFALNLPCCALIFLRTYPAVPLISCRAAPYFSAHLLRTP